MNAFHQAATAYAAAAPIRTHQDTEYDAFAQITHRMRRAARAGRKAFPDLVAALHDNRRLWTILAVEVADEANALPRDLRARIFYLAEFIAQHTPKVLTREAGAEALIEINTAIMRGLRGQTGGS
ncbi:MAG: flagellar biosynthesis regulator FlaF [Rhodobacteraceae bacterium]|nr:flagellar biosynthesis regulator FlaF [Paracoccaceae bacterium]MBL4556362.1 flagellar biosynthesis regulator FlaF [Paracoccaceae bacterium]HBG98205.1 flagellar biosynthesis regulatory protein FlaF [Paracoccaceae bacterium]